MISFAGNDYLGLSRHPEVVAALTEGARRFGVGATGARASVGWTVLHDQLEAGLAQFLGVEDVVIFSEAYLGGAVVFSEAADFRRHAVIDETAHTNLFLGARAVAMTIATYRHLDADDCRKRLSSVAPDSAVLATDTVYAITGETAPVAELMRAARAHGALLFLDDAHGFGVLGSEGRGALEDARIDGSDAVILGSLSKALGCSGGFLAGPKSLIHCLRRNQHLAGCSAPSPAIVSAVLAALRLVRNDSTLRLRLHRVAERMRSVLVDAAIEVVSTKSPIVCMALRDESEAAALSAHFREFDINIPYFQYPSEPRHNLLRAVAKSAYNESTLDRFEQAIRAWKR